MSNGHRQIDPVLQNLLTEASTLMEQQDFNSALKIYQTIANEALKTSDNYFLIMAKLGQGKVLCKSHGCEYGMTYYKEAFQLAMKSGIDSLVFKSMLTLGSGFQRIGSMDSALTEYRYALEYFTQVRDSISIAVILNNVAGVFNSRYQYDSALRVYSHAAEIMKRTNNWQNLIDTYYNIGLTYQSTSNLDSALLYFERSLRLADSLSLSKKIAYAYYSMGEIWEARDQLVKALQYFKLYDEFNQTFLTDVYNSSLADLDAKYQTSQIQLESEARLRVADKRSREKVMVLVLSATLLVVSVIIIWWTIQRKRSVEKIAAKNQQLTNQKINDLLQQQEINSLQGVLEGQEEERQRIASDLHDKLGAILGMVKLHFSAVEDRIDVLRNDNKKQYDKANELLDQASSEVRNISHNLLSGVLVKFGLVPALQDLKDTVEATGKLKVQLVAGEQMDGRLNGDQELQIYRIVQELISNILKHAKATEAVVQLNRTNGEVNLIVEDNGMGFDVEAARQKQGIGLKNLEARAAKLNAKLHFDSGRGAGTTVSVDIPLNSGDS